VRGGVGRGGQERAGERREKRGGKEGTRWLSPLRENPDYAPNL